MSDYIRDSAVNPQLAEPRRRPTTHFCILDGTWCDRKAPGVPSILNTLVEILSLADDDPQPKPGIKYVPGLGARSGTVEKYIGGCFGTGIEGDIIDVIDYLSINYTPGDTLIFIGYSRGAYAARSIVSLLNRIGVPLCDRRILLEIYEKYRAGKLSRRGVAERLRRRFNCRYPVPVKALICIDTVGALGIPRTGICGPLSLLPYFRKKEFLETDMSSDVEILRHALSLHERRAPFVPTLMHVPIGHPGSLTQMWFCGSHGDLGKDVEDGSLVDIPLAWILQELHDIPGVTFNKSKLTERFPRSAEPPRPIRDLARHDWVHDDIRRSVKGIYRLMGIAARQPGNYYHRDRRTDEYVHFTVPMRNYGARPGVDVIQGYQPTTANGQTYYEMGVAGKANERTLSFVEPPRVPVALPGPFEAYLLGVALE